MLTTLDRTLRHCLSSPRGDASRPASVSIGPRASRLGQLIVALALASSPGVAAADDCHDFGRLGVMMSAGMGSLVSGVVTTGMTVLLYNVDEGTNGVAVWFSGFLVGGLAVPAVGMAATWGCPLDIDAQFGLQMGVAGVTTAAASLAGHYLFRHAPMSVGYVPMDGGGGSVVLGGRF